MKNHFDISDSIEIRNVSIAGDACIKMHKIRNHLQGYGLQIRDIVKYI